MEGEHSSGTEKRIHTGISGRKSRQALSCLLYTSFGYSKSRFSHLFHEYFGSGISEYVNTLRCKAAAEALARHEVSMVEIAMGVGFESARTFYRAFKRCYGMTPSQYASRHTAGKVYRTGAAGGKSIFG